MARQLEQTTKRETVDRKDTKKLDCARCLTSTNHQFLYVYRVSWDVEEAGLHGATEYQTISCLGCDSVHFSTESWNSEDLDDVFNPDSGRYELGPIVEVSQYPETNLLFEKAHNYYSLTTQVKTTYLEVYKALTNNMPKLAAVGMRMVIEMICADNEIKNGKLVGKINQLHEKGIVTESMKDTLHSVRIFGNNKAHSESTPSSDNLEIAWKVVNNLLRSIYGTKDSKTAYKDKPF